MNITLRWRVAQYFEKRWWQSYLSGKSVDEYLTWKRAYWNSVIEKVGQLAPELGNALNTNSLNILDAGCGPAGVYLVLNDHRVTAIDPLWSSYEQQFGHLGYDSMSHVQFDTMPLEALEINERMDMVLCMNALNHVADIELSTQKLIAALKPGGWLIITMDTHNYSILKWLFKSIPGDILHPHQNDRKGYVDLIATLGTDYIDAELLKSGTIFDHELIVFKKRGV